MVAATAVQSQNPHPPALHVEAVEEEFGEETKKNFEDDLREAFRNRDPLREKQTKPHLESDATSHESLTPRFCV